jgi:hypothetical protein
MTSITVAEVLGAVEDLLLQVGSAGFGAMGKALVAG